MQLDREEHDHQHAHPERGHRQADQRHDRTDPVEDAARARGGGHAHPDAQQHRPAEGHPGEQEGRGQAFEIDLDHRLPVIDRHAQVAGQRVADEAEVLDQQRLIEAELLAQCVDVGLACARLQQHRDRVAANLAEEEDRQRQDRQRDDGIDQPPQEKARAWHQRLPSPGRPITPPRRLPCAAPPRRNPDGPGPRTALRPPRRSASRRSSAAALRPGCLPTPARSRGFADR